MGKAYEGRIAWKVVFWVFGIGLALWVVQLVVTLWLVKAEATWFPGVHFYGGEWDGWFGLGWEVDRTWCFGTIETCANSRTVPRFTFSPIGTLICTVVWAGICLGIGWIVALCRGRAKRPT